MLAQEQMFGIPPFQQRLFFMGRELKNGGRPLSAIGLRSLEPNVIHLHVRPMIAAAAAAAATTIATTASITTRNEIQLPPVQKRRRIHNTPAMEVRSNRRQITTTNARAVASQQLVDLLESDSESNDDNDNLEVVSHKGNNTGQKNNRGNQGDGKCTEFLSSNDSEVEVDDEEQGGRPTTRLRS
jgi:hypothetical protein